MGCGAYPGVAQALGTDADRDGGEAGYAPADHQRMGKGHVPAPRRLGQTAVHRRRQLNVQVYRDSNTVICHCEIPILSGRSNLGEESTNQVTYNII